MLKGFFKQDHTTDTISLAWPLVLTQVGHIITGMVDNIFLGHLGPTEQAAGILSNNVYVLLLVFTIGMSYAATPLTTGARGSNDLLRRASIFKNSLFLNFSVAVICFLLLFFISDLLKYMQQPADVAALAVPFFDIIVLSIIPLSLFFTCKQYCEGLSNTRMALLISISGNIINIFLNYVLIYGTWGFPELGYLGAAWASFYARVFMGVSFLILVFSSRFTGEIAKVIFKVRINLVDLKNLFRIGINSAMQFIFEVAAFVIAGLMAGSFGRNQIDAHGIALSIAAFTYMFASGIGSAATIRVGVFRARSNWKEISAASKAAVRLSIFVMGGFGIIFLFSRDLLVSAFSNHSEIIGLASGLLVIAALFQLFDGIQVTILGILRGLEDVKVPTVITLVGYWVIALPLAYLLAFVFKMETVGIWIALLVSLVFVAGLLLWRLSYLLKKNLTQAHPEIFDHQLNA